MDRDFVSEPFSSGHHNYFKNLLYLERSRLSRVLTLDTVTFRDGFAVWVMSRLILFFVGGRDFWSCGFFTRVFFLPLSVFLFFLLSRFLRFNLFFPCFDYYLSALDALRFFKLDSMFVVIVAPQNLTSHKVSLLERCSNVGLNVSMLRLYSLDLGFVSFCDPVEPIYFNYDFSLPRRSGGQPKILLIGYIDSRKNVEGLFEFARSIGGADICIVGEWDSSYYVHCRSFIDRFVLDLSHCAVSLHLKRYDLDEEVAYYDEAEFVWVGYKNHSGSSGVVLRSLLSGRRLLFNKGEEISSYASMFPDFFVNYETGLEWLDLASFDLNFLRAELACHNEDNVVFFP